MTCAKGYYAQHVQSRFLLVVALTACGDDTSPGQDASGSNADAAAIDAPLDCGCTYSSPMSIATVANVDAVELSGLATSRALANTLWTHNDSGDSARLFAIGTDGATRGVLSITGATANDWEDMAIGPCGASGWCLYAADIGDNPATRPNVRVYEIDEPAQINGAQSATARTFEVAYPDGAHNSEALVIDPRDGEAYIITKQTPPGPTTPSKVFRMPKSAALATAVEVGTLTIPTGNMLVTGADLYADDCSVRLLVRTYTHVFELSAPPDTSIADLLTGTPTSRPVASETQGEAIAWLPDGRGYVTVSEGQSAALSRVVCD
jgi:hypothetical protein